MGEAVVQPLRADRRSAGREVADRFHDDDEALQAVQVVGAVGAEGGEFVVEPGGAAHAAVLDARGAGLDVDGHFELADQVPVPAGDDGGADPGEPAAERDGEGVEGEEDGAGFGVHLVGDEEEGDLVGMRRGGGGGGGGDGGGGGGGGEGLVGEDFEGGDGGVAGLAEVAVAGSGEEEDGVGRVEDVAVYLCSEL